MKVTIELPKPGEPFFSKLFLLAALEEARKGNCVVERVSESGIGVESWIPVELDRRSEDRFLEYNWAYRIQPPPPFQYKSAHTLPESGVNDMCDMIEWIKKQYRNVHTKAPKKTLACKVEISFNEVVETPKPNPSVRRK